jgi:hypothetical protein
MNQNAKVGKQVNYGVQHKGTITLSADTIKEEIKKDPAGVIATLIQQHRTLFNKQIEHWIWARANAENPLWPIRTMLYDIYEDVMIDGFLTGLVYNHRILPIKNKAFKIKNAAGEADDVKTKWFQVSWFRELCKFSLESIFYGHSLNYFDELEFDGKTSWVKKVTLIPRKHVIPEKHLYTKYQSDLTGIDYEQPPVSNYVIPVGDCLDLGLLNKATPLVILKKHGWNNWDQFAERFGMPIMTVKTSSQDARVQSEIEGWLKNLSTGAYGIFPADTELDIKESKKTDAFQVFSELIDKVDAELAILINGQTMTSMNGSSRSQGEVHERVKDEITKDDEIFFATLVNEKLIPLLRDKHGYPFEDGDHFEWDQPEDLQALLKIYQGVNNMGFQLDPDEVSEKFNVKIIGLKQVAPAPPGKTDEPGNDPEPGDEPNEDDEPANDAPEENDKPGKGGKKNRGKKINTPKGADDDDPELSAKNILKLHADIQELMGGKHVR